MRRSGLGRGLSSLIPTEVGTEPDGQEHTFVELPLDAITPNAYQPRSTFDEEALSALTASIREIGVLQPVLVRPIDDDRYELIAGERRWRAARRAGLSTIPAVVKRSTDDLASLEQALVENLHRADLSALEEAAAYQQLIEDFGLTHEQVATRVGRSRTTVTNTLRLLQLPPTIQHLLADGRLSAGHARALLGCPDRAFQESVARRAVEEGWSVRAVEDAVRARVQSPVPEAVDEPQRASSRSPGTTRPAGLLELEELLAGFLSTRVSVAMGPKRGRLTIEFADLEDLERIYRLLTEPST